MADRVACGAAGLERVRRACAAAAARATLFVGRRRAPGLRRDRTGKDDHEIATLAIETPDDDEQLRVLRLAYADAVGERDRLRAARGSATQLLGPLPASAGIAIGLFGSLGKDVGAAVLIVAVALLGLMVAIGVAFDNLPPYRVLRAHAQSELGSSRPESAGGEARFELGYDYDVSEREWLKNAIGVERRVYGELGRERRKRRRNGRRRNLQELYELERTGGYLVRLAFLAILVDLVVGAIVRP